MPLSLALKIKDRGQISTTLNYFQSPVYHVTSISGPCFYTVFQKSDAKIEITITTTNLIRIKYPLSSFNYHLFGANVANFNKIHCIVFEQQLFKNWNLKTKVSNMEKSP